jgi:hypothetical protein
MALWSIGVRRALSELIEMINFPSITIGQCVFTEYPFSRRVYLSTEYPFSRGVYSLNTVLVGAYPLNTVLVGEYPLNTVLVGVYPLYTVNTPYSLNTYLEGPFNWHMDYGH